MNSLWIETCHNRVAIEGSKYEAACLLLKQASSRFHLSEEPELFSALETLKKQRYLILKDAEHYLELATRST